MHCSIEECNFPSRTKGLCVKHYTRFLRYGNTDTVLMPRGQAKAFFLSLFDRNKSRCINWPFTTSGQDKRPWMKLNGRRGYVARFVCERELGVPDNPHQCAHNCGNLSCVNPKHLRWDTAVGNAKDKHTHLTHINGSLHGSSKLTEAQVLEMRELAKTKSVAFLAREYGVCHAQAKRIVKREQWRHI